MKIFFKKLRNRALVWDTLTTTGWSTLGKGAGFIAPFFIAAWFGVTGETDAFFFTYGLILFFSMVFAPVVESVIVTYIAEARTKGEDTGKFVGNILAVSGIGLILLTVAMLLVIKPILALVTRFDAKSLNLVYQLLVLASPLIILLVLTSVLSGTLNAYKKFAFPAVAPAFRAIIVIAFIFMFKERYGVYSIALGYVIGEIFRLIVLLFVAKTITGFRLKLSLGIAPRLREFLKTSSYQIIGMAAVGLNPIVDRTMASWLGEGSVSVLHYADRLYMIPITFFSAGLLIPLLSHWSGRYYNSGFQRLNKDLNRTLKVVGLASLFFTILLILFSQPLTRLAFGRGAFVEERLSEVGWVWVCYLLGFSFHIMGQIYIRAYLVLKQTKILMWCSFFTVIFNIMFNYALMLFFGVYGIALASTFVSMFYFIGQIYLFRKFIVRKIKF